MLPASGRTFGAARTFSASPSTRTSMITSLPNGSTATTSAGWPSATISMPSGPQADGQLAIARRVGVRAAALRCRQPPAAADDDVAAVAGRLQQVHRRRTDELGDEDVRRVVVDLVRRPDLLELPGAEDGDPVREAHRLRLVVGDEDHRRPELALERLELRPGMDPQLGVEVRQRLVHQEDARLADDRPRQRDPLLLAAGQLRRAVAAAGGRSRASRRPAPPFRSCSARERRRTLSG